MFLPLAESAWFLYIVMPLTFILLCYIVEGTHNVGWATTGVVIALLALQFFTDIRPLSYVVSNPIETLIIIAIYVVLGVGYVWLKWVSFTRSSARKMKDYLKAQYSTTTYTSDQLNSAAMYLGFYSCPIKVSNYKVKIMGWMIYWPISGAWTLLNDPVRRLFEFVYESIAVSLQEISNNAFKDISKS